MLWFWNYTSSRSTSLPCMSAQTQTNRAPAGYRRRCCEKAVLGTGVETSLRHQGGGEIIPPNRWQSNLFLLPWAAKWSTVQMDGSWWYPVQWQCCVAGKAEIYDTCAKSASKKVWASWPLPLRRRAADNTLLWEGAVSVFSSQISPPCPALPCQNFPLSDARDLLWVSGHWMSPHQGLRCPLLSKQHQGRCLNLLCKAGIFSVL